MKFAARWGVVSLSLIMACGSVFSQEQRDEDQIPPWYLSLGGGYIRYEGDEATKNGGFALLRLGYDVSSHWSFEGSFYYMPNLASNAVYNYDNGYPELRNGLQDDSTSAYGLTGDALLHILSWEDRHWDPYLLAGAGLLYYDVRRQGRADPADITLRSGAGLAYHFNPEWAIRAELIGHMTVDRQEFNLLPSAGVNWRWGTRTPKKFAVTGGPADSDGDGLTDEEELQLGTNPKDPDTDRDKLTDGEEVKKYFTDPLNPDTDYDGLEDGAEVFDHKTNPLLRDTDKGGVADGHEVIEDHTNPLDPSDDLLLFTLHIEFETNKADIRPTYFNDLNIIGKVLSRDSGATARIEGHADKRKTSVAKYNMQLSERRAKAVMEYLSTQCGIHRDRMKAVGYGFTRPMAPNDRINGNEKNRRVEVYIRKGADQPGAPKPTEKPSSTPAVKSDSPEAAKSAAVPVTEEKPDDNEP